MRALRRHFLYAEQANETSVGDHASKTSVLQLWLARRQELLTTDEQLPRMLTFFWTLAKPTHAVVLNQRHYVVFFQCVAKALVQSVSADHHAHSLATRDWLYDCAGSPAPVEQDKQDAVDPEDYGLSLDQFKEALFQCAELVLPAESDAAAFVAFFDALRDAIVAPRSETTPPNLANETASHTLRALRDVTKISGAFLQKVPPNAEHLALVRGLLSPDMESMSLKQLLLSYNPRKFSLSRKFSSLFTTTETESSAGVAVAATTSGPSIQEEEKPRPPASSPLLPSPLLSRESDDAFDIETSVVQSLENFPALRISVVGPPCAGKTRVARSLATRLELQYISMSTAIEDAIVQTRDRERVAAELALKKQQEAEEAQARTLEAATEAGVVEGGDEATPPESEAASEAFFIPLDDQQQQQNQEESTKQEDDLAPASEELLSSDDLARLMNGEALSRDRALPLLIAFARRILLTGVGIVLDDVLPRDVHHALTLDYVVSLEMSREDAQVHCGGLTLAPTSKRVYSVRERAMLSECDAVLREKGLMDATGFSAASNPGEVGENPEVTLDDEIEKRRLRVADAMAAAAQALAAARKPKPLDGDADPATDEDHQQKESVNGGVATDDASGNRDPDTTAQSVVVQQSPAQRNEIVALDESTVPLRSLLLDTFSDRYREYERRIGAGLVSSPRTQIITVLATQALHDILAQCVAAMTTNSLGVSRSATSRAALRVSLPDDEVTSSGSRSEQLRWLLYGDWTEFLTAGTGASEATRFAAGPVDPQQPRQLSRWRDVCPVSSSSSSSSETVLGDPQWAVYFSSRVYLFATATARDQFCAAPLQYLRREPQMIPTARKIWILSSGPLDKATAHELSSAVEGDYVSATALLTEPLGLPETANLVAESLQNKNAWVLTDLIPSRDVVTALKERQCLPDVIIQFTVSDEELPMIYKTPLEKKKHALWTAQFGAPDALTEILADIQPSSLVQVRQCPLFSKPHETRAALLRVLSPLAARVDAAEHGTQREATEHDGEITTVFTPVTADVQEESDETPAQGDTAGEEGAETTQNKKEELLVGYSARQRAWLSNRNRMGETAQFCPVSWTTKRVLVPGIPTFTASFQQKLYALAGAREREAFVRDPQLYVPLTASATQSLVPVVWLLGVRGAECLQLAHSAAQSLGVGDANGKIGIVDVAAIASRVQQRLKSQLLLPLDKQTPLVALYAEELSAQVQQMTRSSQWQLIVLTNISTAGIVVAAQLDVDSEQQDDPSASPSTTSSPPPLPTPELLALCFERDLFPTLVLPVDASEELIVQRQLQLWRAAQPPPRPRRKPATKSGEDQQNEDEEDEAAVDPAELEAAETVRLQEQFLADSEALTTAVETLRARGLTIDQDGLSIDATARAVVKKLAHVITMLLARKDSLFEFCERVSLPRAQQLLRSGEATVGKHALLCPITGESSESSLSSGLLYRGRLYFPRSSAALAQCELSPAARLVAPVSQKPSCCISCCVVGPPSAGKTTLARQLARTFGLAYVSPQSAVDWVLQCLGPHSNLYAKLKLATSSNPSNATSTRKLQHLDADVVHAAIYTRLRSADCQRQGWVLDGYMASSTEMARCLDKTQTIHPGVVFVLESSFQRTSQMLLQRQQQSHNAHDDLERRAAQLPATFAAWQKHRLDLLDTWSSTFGAFHIRQIDVDTNSAWQVHAMASAVMQQHLHATTSYVRYVAMTRPARLYGITRPQHSLNSQAHSVFQSFCPVELFASSGGRYHSTLPQRRELCVECTDVNGNSTVLWLANAANLITFCTPATATVFLTHDATVSAKELISKAPVDASLLSLLSVADCEFPEIKGYCPVTFQHGTGDKDWQAIRKGSVFYRVSYGSKVFFCLSEHAKRQFTTQPELFASLVLPTKLPPQLTQSSAFKSCPGRIEQELSSVLNETLLVLGATRPKFLGMSARASACVYVALLLKTRTTSKAIPDHVRAKYSEQLRAFERDCRICEQLKSLISPSGTTSCGPAIKGVRAVRELSASASATLLLTGDSGGPCVAPGRPAAPVAESDETVPVETLRQRFDELAQSANSVNVAVVGRNANQQPSMSSPRACNDQFLAYTTPLSR